jgi:hypothetical protein
MSSRCIGSTRHWFTIYGMPGLRSPFCVRGCGTPNPVPLEPREWDELLYYRDRYGRLDAEAERAIAAELERRAVA